MFKPWKEDLSEIIALLNPQDQIKANYGCITKAKLGRVFSGDPVNGIYGLFAATEIGKVKYLEIFGQNAPDFEIHPPWL